MRVVGPSLDYLAGQSHHDLVAAKSHHAHVVAHVVAESYYDYMHEKTMLLDKTAAREYHSCFLDASGCF